MLLQDPTGEVNGGLHSSTVQTYPALAVGCVLVLQQVCCYLLGLRV